MALPLPAPASEWRHRNGIVYVVMLIANEGSERPEYPPTVVYYNKQTNTPYSRPVSDWARSMTEVVK